MLVLAILLVCFMSISQGLYFSPHKVGIFKGKVSNLDSSGLDSTSILIKKDISSRYPFTGLIEDSIRRNPHYISDWKDGFRKRSIGAVLFMYFACLAPAIAFGGITNLITNGKMGVIEYLISCGFSGIFYAVFSGQPMTFVGPTGLTLAFIASLYRFTESAGLPFLPIYSWTGMWTSMFLALAAILNSSNCYRFFQVNVL